MLDALTDEGLQVTLRPGVNLRFEESEPALDFFANGLALSSNDDVLIASILAASKKSPQERILLATADVGLKVKARHRNIPILRLPDELKLPEEQDANERKITEPEDKVRKLSSTMPELKILFSDSSDHLKFSVGKLAELRIEDMTSRMTTLRSLYPKLWPPNDNSKVETNSVSPFHASVQEYLKLIGGPSSYLEAEYRQEIERYNTNLDAFFGECERHIPKLWAYQDAMARTIELGFLLNNNGHAPADDIDVILQFPEAFEVKDDSNRLGPPNEPIPPKKPERGKVGLPFQGIATAMPDNFDFVRNMRVQLALGNVSPPNIRETRPWVVEYHIKRLKHGLHESLGFLYLTFDSYDTAASFAVGYRINAGNFPQEIVGNLHVIVEKKQEPIPFS